MLLKTKESVIKLIRLFLLVLLILMLFNGCAEKKAVETSVSPQKIKNIPNTEVVIHNGSLTTLGQVDEYKYVPDAAGQIRVELCEMRSGFTVGMYLYDSSGKELIGSMGYSNGKGFSYTVEAEETYFVRIKQNCDAFEQIGDYRLTIGTPKTPTDITGYTKIYDKIEYNAQCNTYTFQPKISGSYRFEICEKNNGVQGWLQFVDRLGYCFSELSSLNNEKSGITIYELKAGETYTITFRALYYSEDNRSEYGQYCININYPNEEKVVKLNTAVEDRVLFLQQINEYTFTPEANGDYEIEFSEMKRGFTVECNVYDYLENEVYNDIYCSNGHCLRLNKLKAGQPYRITVSQRENGSFGTYTIKIS